MGSKTRWILPHITDCSPLDVKIRKSPTSESGHSPAADRYIVKPASRRWLWGCSTCFS